jgi:hypothetical protein
MACLAILESLAFALAAPVCTPSTLEFGSFGGSVPLVPPFFAALPEMTTLEGFEELK